MYDRAVPLTLLILASLWCCRGSRRVSVSVTPGATVFEGGFFLLQCGPAEKPNEWAVLRNASKRRGPQRCGDGWGKYLNNSCKVGLAVTWDSGAYWCQSTGGAVSNTVGVRVTRGRLLVDVPSLPVYLGDRVTLRCVRREFTSIPGHFYKDDLRLTSDPVLAFPLGSVSAADGGSYQCSDGSDRSSPALLQVINQSRPLSERDFPAPDSFSEPDSILLHLGLRVFCHLVVVSPYCVSTVLMLSLYRQRPKDGKRFESRVKKEDGEDVTAAVTTEHHF